MEKPLLKYFDTYQMIQRITCASNEDIMKIKEMLVDRAKKHRRELASELQFFVELKNALIAYCKGKKISIKLVTIKEFANDLQIIIDLYKDAPQKIIYKKVKHI